MVKGKVIVLRYGELYLKGKNRDFFENVLIRNIRAKLKPFACEFIHGRSRYVVQNYDPQSEVRILEALKTVFGLYSMSVAMHITSDYESILECARQTIPQKGRFRVSAHRADKTYPQTSVQLAARLGGDLLDAYHNLQVDLHSPEFTVFVDIREDKTAYVYSTVIPCAGGMPVGSAGRGLLLLSGGIDSPVAGYMLSKRGMELTALHFHSYPYTGERAKEKVMTLARTMQNYCGKITLLSVSVTEIQETIHAKCSDSYMITLLRRFMMTIASRVAEKFRCGCIINGESLGQVASQTLESITVTNDCVKDMPVFRPLIGMDKQEIIEIAAKIGTYETSILPYEDCCTVFLPERPATKPTLERARDEESKITNYDQLISAAIDNLEIIKL